jgi:hypothetical protein
MGIHLGDSLSPRGYIHHTAEHWTDVFMAIKLGFTNHFDNLASQKPSMKAYIVS